MIRGAVLWAVATALLLQGCAVRHGSTGKAATEAWQEYEIHTDDRQPYPVQLEAGQFVRAVVDQGNVDVEVSLLGPDGQEIRKPVDSLDRAIWDEEIAAVAERTGLYQIVVHLPKKNATGRYRIRIDGPRRATDEDRLRIEALGLNYEAVELVVQDMKERSEKRLPRQLELRQRALALWQQLGDRPREAEALYHLALVQGKLDQSKEASRLLHVALSGLTDAAQRAQVLNEAGRIDWDPLDNVQEARRHFEEAQELLPQFGDPPLKSDVLQNLGRFHTNVLGAARVALADYYPEALRQAEKAGDLNRQAKVLINMGSAYDALADYGHALEAYRHASKLANGSYEKATALNNLGDTYHALGDKENAAEYFGQALKLDQAAGDRESEAKTLQNLGVIQEKSEKPGHIDEALRSYEKALDLAREIRDPDLQASILTNRGYLYLGQGENRQALESCREALRLASRRETQARTFHILGAAQRLVRDLDAARQSLYQALTLSNGDLALEADITLVLAKVEHDAGHLDQAAKLAKDAIQNVEDLRERVARQDLRELFLASKQAFYEFYVDVLMEQEGRYPGRGHAAQALEMNERARARGLLDLLAEAAVDLSRDADPDLLKRERQLRADIGALYQLRLKLIKDKVDVNDERRRQAESRLSETIEELHQATAELKASSPHYAALARPEPLNAKEIQKVLDPGSLLLEYALGDKRSWLWVVSRESITGFELHGRSVINEKAQALYDQLTALSAHRDETPAEKAARIKKADRELPKTAAELSQMLLGKAEPLLADRRLLVVSDGALHFVPFNVLPLPSSVKKGRRPSLLIGHNEAVNLASASTLAVLREDEAKREAPGKLVAAFGDPVFQEQDDRLRHLHPPGPTGESHPRGWDLREGMFDPSRLSRLRFSKYEVEEIVRLAGAEQSLKALGLDASRELVTSGELAHYRILHFATHGMIDAQKPELSALVFSRFDAKGKPLPAGEELLRLPDIYNLHLNADLVVLSACETALGQEMKGEGLIGLTRGFMYAGSARVLASLWQVDDQQTAVLMQHFYRALLAEHRTAPAALREAQRKALEEGLHPYFWAGFSLQGEPR